MVCEIIQTLKYCGFIAPIIIPSTPNSELLKMMREVAKTEIEPGLRVNNHQKASPEFQPSRPVRLPEGRLPSMPGWKRTRWKLLSVKYTIVLYIGETAQNLFTRGKEHILNYEARNRESS